MPDEQGSPIWTVKALQGRLEYHGEGKTFLRGTGISGQFYKDGKSVSTFVGERAEADQQKKTVILERSVKLTSIEQRAVLSADKMVRRPDGHIEATGNVRFEGPRLKIGPMPRFLATSDLKVMATPKLFKELINKK